MAKIKILQASENKIIVSKKKVKVDENNTMDYAIRAKKIYLGANDSEENYMEIDDLEE